MLITLRKRISSSRAAVAIETAIITPALLLILLIGIDLLRVSFTAISLQYGVNEGARFAALMEAPEDPNRTESILDQINFFSGLNVKKAEVLKKFCNLETSLCSSHCNEANGWPSYCPYDTMMSMQIEYPINLASLAGATLNLRAFTVYKNEPKVGL